MRTNNEDKLLPEPSSSRGLSWPHIPTVTPSYTVQETVAGAGDSVGLDEVMNTLRRRKYAIAGIALLGMMAGFVVSLCAPVTYRARTSLQLEGFTEVLRDIAPISPTLANATVDNYLQNQVKLLQSETLARRVAERMGNRENAYGSSGFAGQLGKWAKQLGWQRHRQVNPMEERVKKVQNSLTVRTTLQSQVIELFCDDSDAERAAKGANLAAEQFIALNREGRDELIQNTTEWLSKEAAALKIKLDQANQNLQNFGRASGIVFAGTPATLTADRMRQVQQALSIAESERAAKEARYEAAIASGTEGLPDALATGSIQKYQLQREDLKRQLADLKTLYTSAHDRVQRVESQLAEVEKSIARERNEMIGRLRTDFEAAAGLERRLKDSYNRQFRQVQDETEKEGQYNVRKHEVDTLQSLYDAMLRKVKEASAASALQATNVRVIDPAAPPAHPYSPNIPLNLAVGLAVGTFGGIGFVFARERSDRVKQPADASLLNLPVLGVIPSAKDDRDLKNGRSRLLSGGNGDGDLALVTWQHDDSILSESFRATLASILFGHDRARVLVVTSLKVMEGKTTILANLGIALAETNRRILLIDSDLRRPRLHQVFDICNDMGLADMLQNPESTGTAPLTSVARATGISNLWVLPSGPGPAGIPQLLYSANLRALLDRAREEFDFVLIDSPPMLLYPDGRVLGKASDGIVMAVRANKTSREELKSAHQRFLQDGIPVLGMVLNEWRMDKSQHSAYNDNYSHYRRSRTAG